MMLSADVTEERLLEVIQRKTKSEEKSIYMCMKMSRLAQDTQKEKSAAVN